ncbi:MAG: hypothetical protein ACE5GX_02495 [Thermoanaerobaculia bacterium]
MRVETERLYRSLPAFVRNRDYYEGQPLRALMAVLEHEYRELHEDISGLYNDWFIETCQKRIAPLLGELIGIRGLDRPENWFPSQRTRIANTLFYRHRKGTEAVVARAARDVTGWPCRTVAFYKHLGVTQSAEHPRPDRGRLVNVSDELALADFDSPFDRISHRPQISGSPGLEPLPSPRGGYNLASLGLFFWRLPVQPVEDRAPRRVGPGRYTFHPLGVDQPLFLPGRSTGRRPDNLGKADVTGPISRTALARLEWREEVGILDAQANKTLTIFDAKAGKPIPWEWIAIADLSCWDKPRVLKTYEPTPADAENANSSRDLRVTLDPETGRLLSEKDPRELRLTYHYAFSAPLGGGPYDRRIEARPGGPEAKSAGQGALLFPGLAEATREAPSARRGPVPPEVIRIVDSATYDRSPIAISVRDGSSMRIEAEPGEAPTILKDLVVQLGNGGGTLTLSGLALGGRVIIRESEPGALLRLEVEHCTIYDPDRKRLLAPSPEASWLAFEPTDPAAFPQHAQPPRSKVAVRIESSIVNALFLGSESGTIEAIDSILDGASGPVLAGAEPDAVGCPSRLERCTVLGGVSVAQLDAIDVLFDGPVRVSRPHLGALVCCYVPPGDPRPEVVDKAGAPIDGNGGGKPGFTSRHYGQPGYAQLSDRCPRRILTGASNGSEIGAFSGLRNPFREANLKGILGEYLPWGLEPRVFHVT